MNIVDFDQITALVLVVGCMILLLCGINGEVKSILTISAGYLFGVGLHGRIKKGK